MALREEFPEPDDATYLREVYDRIQRHLGNERFDADLRLWAADQLRAGQPLLDRALRGGAGLELFLTTYLRQEREKYEAYETGTPVEETPYDSLRSDPLCTCGVSRCPVQAGDVPSKVASAEEPMPALRDWVRSHSGTPLVLVGQPDRPGSGGALGEFSDLRGRAARLLRGIDVHLTEDQDGEPDADPAAKVGLRGES